MYIYIYIHDSYYVAQIPSQGSLRLHDIMIDLSISLVSNLETAPSFWRNKNIYELAKIAKKVIIHLPQIAMGLNVLVQNLGSERFMSSLADFRLRS